MSEADWVDLLAGWSRALVADSQIASSLPPEAIASGWLGFPGATDERIAEAESRLGTRLPPSYHAFLKVTNGWRQTGCFIDHLWSTEEIEWFAVRNQDWIDAYVEPWEGVPDLSDGEYYVYGKGQDCTAFRVEYLQTALEISDTGDSAIYLLNPRVVTPDGEWEAWFFANWLPGANRYRSFREMMEAEYRSYLELRKISVG